MRALLHLPYTLSFSIRIFTRLAHAHTSLSLSLFLSLALSSAATSVGTGRSLVPKIFSLIHST